jgi:hypothetical protein
MEKIWDSWHTVMIITLYFPKLSYIHYYYYCKVKYIFSMPLVSVHFAPRPNVTTCPYRLGGLPSWLWPKCNRFLRLGPPQGTLTFPRLCEWWYVWAWSIRRSFKPKFYRLPRPWSLLGSSPTRENSHVRTENRPRDLRVISQKCSPPSHEAGPVHLVLKNVYRIQVKQLRS